MYDPQLGRFLQTDPVGYQDDFNLYAYVYNDPLNRTDPSGTEGVGCWNNGLGCGEVGVLGPGLSETGAAVLGVVVDFTPIAGDIKGGIEAVLNPTATNITAAAVGLIPGVGDVASKALKTGADVIENAADANRAASRAKGIPDSQIGPSGKPKVHTVQHSTTKSAGKRHSGKRLRVVRCASMRTRKMDKNRTIRLKMQGART